ncbi:MAG TPA: response regulator [Blastocatellia bacterium]|nr:response regulator [Blastocatellia bacterium]
MNYAPLILVVEDHEASRGFLKALFRVEGYRVIEAADGEEALSLLAQHRPDLIITDLMMPGMSGQEFIRRVRAQPHYSGTPIVVTTALEKADLISAARRGVELYLRKPLDTDRIVREVRRLLAPVQWHPQPTPAGSGQVSV